MGWVLVILVSLVVLSLLRHPRKPPHFSFRLGFGFPKPLKERSRTIPGNGVVLQDLPCITTLFSIAPHALFLIPLCTESLRFLSCSPVPVHFTTVPLWRESIRMILTQYGTSKVNLAPTRM